MPNEAVEKVFLAFFWRCKSLILLSCFLEKSAFLDFSYSLNATLTSARHGPRSGKYSV